ncbi:MAG: 16S rRNA (cytidine(1402)-2'-O)-methyltransferase [Rhizobiales bacterium]|nr:16S rRNA (cytidine(1402)-2'-O)-methyltransferase [Hyphomicrobiales bacterium]
MSTTSEYVIDGHRLSAARVEAGLHLVATPIGNLGDITLRALATLAGADLVLCEDTRTTARLLQRYQIKTRMKPYHDHNAARQRPSILALLREGKSIALVSDAGTPLVSDPGYKLVKACLEEKLNVQMIPGVSAPVMALALSGLPSDQFQFCGFLPAKAGARRQCLELVKDNPATLIFFESAQRLAASLTDIVAIFGDREAAIARELTKLHEEVMRGPVSSLINQIEGRQSVKGEITLVLAPASLPAETAGSAVVLDALAAALRDLPAGKAAADVARRFGLPKKALYEQAISLKAEQS